MLYKTFAVLVLRPELVSRWYSSVCPGAFPYQARTDTAKRAEGEWERRKERGGGKERKGERGPLEGSQAATPLLWWKAEGAPPSSRSKQGLWPLCHFFYFGFRRSSLQHHCRLYFFLFLFFCNSQSKLATVLLASPNKTKN